MSKLYNPNKKKNPQMARWGSKNGRWNKGSSSAYKRRIKGATGKQIVHHKNKNKSDNRPSNLQVLKDLGAHNKKHPEKGRKGGSR